jgi:hypothetical protein
MERYAFLWSLCRMAIAVLSLFLGASPILLGIVGYQVMMLAWLISGVAALYLGYRWFSGGKRVFGGNNQKDTWAFLIMVVTGINLGYTAFSTNIGMNLAYSIVGMSLADLLYKATAVLYAVVVYYLYKRWKENGERVV